MSNTPTPDLVNEALRNILTEVVLANAAADRTELILLAQTAAAAFKAGLAAFDGAPGAPDVLYDAATGGLTSDKSADTAPTGAASAPVADRLTALQKVAEQTGSAGVQLANEAAARGTSAAASKAASSEPAQDAMATFIGLAPAVTAAADKRFAADPFAPTFELFAGEDAITAKLYPRTGSVLYLINVTGPHSTAVKFEAALPKLVRVARVEESPP